MSKYWIYFSNIIIDCSICSIDFLVCLAGQCLLNWLYKHLSYHVPQWWVYTSIGEGKLFNQCHKPRLLPVMWNYWGFSEGSMMLLIPTVWDTKWEAWKISAQLCTHFHFSFLGINLATWIVFFSLSYLFCINSLHWSFWDYGRLWILHKHDPIYDSWNKKAEDWSS